MKQFTSTIAASLLMLWCAMPALGQNTAPRWLNSPPARTATYYYRVSQGIGLTEEEAAKKAFGMALLESAFAIGVPVDLQKMEQLEGDKLLIEASRYVRIPINKVCQYSVELTTRRGYRVYILCQVANDVHTRAEFKPFNCLTCEEEE